MRKTGRKSLGALNVDRWGHLFSTRLKPVPIKQRTGFEGRYWRRVVASLRHGRYFVVDKQVSGDAPKDFIRVYEPEASSRDDPRSWPAHIAKVGHKWYPG